MLQTRVVCHQPELSSMDCEQYDICHCVTGERVSLPPLTPTDVCFEMDTMGGIPGLMVQGKWQSVSTMFAYHITITQTDGKDIKEVRHTGGRSSPVSLQVWQNQHVVGSNASLCGGTRAKVSTTFYCFLVERFGYSMWWSLKDLHGSLGLVGTPDSAQWVNTGLQHGVKLWQRWKSQAMY